MVCYSPGTRWHGVIHSWYILDLGCLGTPQHLWPPMWSHCGSMQPLFESQASMRPWILAREAGLKKWPWTCVAHGERLMVGELLNASLIVGEYLGCQTSIGNRHVTTHNWMVDVDATCWQGNKQGAPCLPQKTSNKHPNWRTVQWINKTRACPRSWEWKALGRQDSLLTDLPTGCPLLPIIPLL